MMSMERSDEQSKIGELGLKLQRAESYPYKNIMTLHHSRPYEGSGGGASPINGCDGPTSLCNCVLTDGGSGGSVATLARPLLQPFSHASSSFKSPNLGFINPFTAAQWQDFERQALIYKHMMASVPVPPHLLMPFPNNTSPTTSITATAVPHHLPLVGRGGTGFNLRFSNNADPEPGRCRRTDGKKWRCSRDVAPDQKYCERHMHRGRPRSRKHVEVQAEINANTTNSISNCSVSSATFMANNNFSNASAVPSAVLKSSSFAAMTSSASPYKEQRGSMEWMLKGGTSNQDLHHLIQMKVGSSTNGATDFQQNYQENLNLNSYSDSQHHQSSSEQYYMFLNNELGSLGDQMCSEQRQRPRQFIDAWSSARDSNSNEANKSYISLNGKFNLSNLTLSMSGGNAHQDGNGNIDESEMGLGVKPLMPLSWMNPVPSMASTPGGPLGEVLQSNAAAARDSSKPTTSRSANANVGLNLMTDNWGGSGGGGDASGSPQAPTISSPSGVLQRTLASLSDSSGSSSPTFTAPAKTDNALHWVSHGKLPSSS
ncbi:hypothetical protein Sjap_005697 [Stephania japonica]|uniref:Growth-regulating factor n=1 Tax=Stephania japonica TaxID=461633 RepID=A0AAP0PKD0_9MAGN